MMGITVDVTSILTAAIALLMAVFTTFAIPWIREKTGVGRWEQLSKAAAMAVTAAEQLAGTTAGKEIVNAVGGKLGYAMDRVKAALAAQGVTFDEATVRAAVEAAVRGMNKGGRVYGVV